MLNELLKSANGPLRELLANAGKSGDSAETVTESVLEVIQRHAQSGDFSGVMEMFSGASTAADGPTVNSLKGEVGNSLSEKLGIDSGQALALAAQALPFLLNIFNKKVNDAPQSNDQIAGSVVESLKKDGESGLGEVFSSIFGTKNDADSFDLGDVIDLGSKFFKK